MQFKKWFSFLFLARMHLIHVTVWHGKERQFMTCYIVAQNDSSDIARILIWCDVDNMRYVLQSEKLGIVRLYLLFSICILIKSSIVSQSYLVLYLNHI